jgi:hypothetical protein
MVVYNRACDSGLVAPATGGFDAKLTMTGYGRSTRLFATADGTAADGSPVR